MTGREGRLTIDGDRAALTFERWLPHPVENVWAAITDAEERAQWLGQSTIDGRVGGHIEMVPSDPPIPAAAKKMTGRITVWDPPHVFEHEWNQRVLHDTGAPTVVRYELRPDGDGTRLTFSHRGFDVRDAGGFRPGTHAYLDRLAAYLAGDPPPDWSVRYRQVAESVYAPKG